MDLDQRIPDLSDKELENLHANALRLVQSGTPIQRQQAESLLPLLGAAVDQRKAARADAQKIKRRTTSTLRKSAAGADAP
jgi:hypothetical protein